MTAHFNVAPEGAARRNPLRHELARLADQDCPLIRFESDLPDPDPVLIIRRHPMPTLPPMPAILQSKGVSV